MAYLKIHSRDWISYYKAGKYPLKLRVIQDDGINVEPSDNIKVNSLKKGKDNILYKQFLNMGDGGITFKVSLLIHKNDVWNIRLFDSNKKVVLDTPKVTTILKKFYTEMTVLQVTTDFIDIPNGNYIITRNPSRTQNYENYTVWELEFTTYRAINTVRYANNNSAVKNAIAKSKKAKNTKSSSALSKKLAKCKLSQMKYSEKKKTVTCVKYLQKALYKKGLLKKASIDGWYGPKTLAAVLKFQIKYRNKYHLSASGKVDKNTLNALCKV